MQVTSTTDLASRRKVTTPARVLAAALMLLITWGATVEVLHKHNGQSINPGETSTVASAGGVNQTQRASQLGECLICQLHLNLFSGLLHALPFTLPFELVFSFTLAFALSHPSTTVSRRRGRAPPPVSLV
ncbi:MAG: hypothetical protein LC754_04525 [Acidobacteria bacterium]|nr:hypothetical protein [Acidobacteriota bacterium]